MKQTIEAILLAASVSSPHYEVIPWISEDGMGTFVPYSVIEVTGFEGIIGADGERFCNISYKRISNRPAELVVYTQFSEGIFTGDEPPWLLILVLPPEAWSLPPMSYYAFEKIMEENCNP
ncbi:hypothetical protein KC845_01335 [Candidatus Kaiserbacteria bacterium]|nr:hypothetical protein [Candidatus Kaiserbacteria bacterium]